MSTINAVGDKILVTAGCRVFVLDKEDSACKIIDSNSFAASLPVVRKPRSTEGDNEEEKENISSKDTHSILCSSLSNDQKYFAIGLTSKIVLIFNVENFELIRGFRIPKAPTSMTFDKTNEFVLLGDRAGHVCRYKINEAINVSHKDITGELCGHEGEPLAGVISMVLDVALSTDGKFMLFADRDEKIRVSRYPQAFVTQAYCLGHTEYIRTIAVIEDGVYSSGGDSVIIRWNIEDGALLRKSAKVSEDDAVRKIVCTEKGNSIFICAILENDNSLYIYEDNGSEILARGSIKVDDVLMDISLYGDSVFGVTKSSTLKFDLSNNSSESIKITEELKNELVNTKDPIGSYYKKVTHKNLEDYQKRKAQRIETEREKKKRRKEKIANAAKAADN